MARAAEKQAKDTYNTSQGVVGTGQKNANDIFGQLMPQYQQEAVNPQGFGASGLAAMNTAAQQSTGGSTGGAVGQGDLMAARMRNKGGFQVAGDESAREGMRTNAQASVENQAANEKLKQAQKQAGLAGEAGLYGENMHEILGGLGEENNATKDLTEAGKSGWLQNTMGILDTVGGMGKAAFPGGIPHCWIAAELYGGWDDPRTSLIRAWLAMKAETSIAWKALVSLYCRFGERVAGRMKVSPVLRWAMKYVFDRILRRAESQS